ncbi:hypothetical protein [Chamaesiphon polymorphus]|uniref:Uncharacterized protein n=1 Tax=Chamaesiphon polymorphus CCALA 037 TaxID=2107692 RepID=A0A2T1G6R7_9CYAN|nr:hypothetical protein [Chamaesiphon polymorphus]PSB52938.1 hypothetical protein C7B77_20000 [Chamaesiphon polymorphus CCALA 037]
MYTSTANYPLGRRVKCFNFTQNHPTGSDIIEISYGEVISIDLPENYQEFNNPLTDESWEVTGYSIKVDAGKISEVIFDLKRNSISR